MQLQTLEPRRLLASYFVDPASGNDSANGSSGSPFKTITAALTRATQPGDVVNLQSGTYRGESAKFAGSGTSGNPITLQAASGATPIVKGSRVVTGWSQQPDGSYRTAWNYYFGRWNGSFFDARDAARNQFFVDGKLIQEVKNQSDLASTSGGNGKFWIDDAANQVYVKLSDGSNPSSHLMEGSDTENALLRTDGHDHLVVRGIQFMHNSNDVQIKAAVRIDWQHNVQSNKSTNVLFDNVKISFASGAGLSLTGSNNTLKNVTLSDNQGIGLHTDAPTDCLIQGGSWLRNNTHPGKQFDRGWEAGGAKFSHSRNITVDGVTAAHNWGSGIWFDVDNRNAVITNSIAHDNLIGIHYEISYTATITNNLVYQNRTQGQYVSGPVGLGIHIAASPGCKVIGNTVWGNEGAGIDVSGGNRSVNGVPISSYANEVYSNIVVDNATAYQYNKNIHVRSNPSSAYSNSVVPFAPNKSNYNTFYLSPSQGGGSRAFFDPVDLSDRVTLEQWRAATGFDMNSVWGDPKLVNPAGGDFKLQSGSAAINKGTFRSEAPKDRVGASRIAGSVDAGAYELGGASPPNPTPVQPPLDAHRIDSFSLINADTDQVIAGYESITAATTIKLSSLPTRNLSIRANAPGSVKSVKFFLNGKFLRTESQRVFAMWGDRNGTDYYAWKPSIGTYTISATGYSSTGGTGTAGKALSFTLKFT